tara:strand:+ start:2423 stop:3322 length:900 start_codon:yes stop_codon:yes gene_type:complete
MNNDLKKLIDDLDVRSIQPHPNLTTWNGRDITDIDWVGDGVVLYYSHGKNDDCGVFRFVANSIALLKQKQVKCLYIEDEGTRQTAESVFALNNDTLVARELSKGHPVQYKALLYKLTLFRCLKNNGIQLRSLEHETSRAGLTYLEWYKTAAIERDQAAVKLIKNKHKSTDGPIVALVGAIHVLFGLQLNLPGIFIANDNNIKTLQSELQPGIIKSPPPANFYSLFNCDAPSRNEEIQKLHRVYPNEDFQLIQKVLNHRDSLIKHFALLLAVKSNENQRYAVYWIVIIGFLLAMLAYYNL